MASRTKWQGEWNGKASGMHMPRFLVNIFLLVALMPVIGACAPRSTPAPLEIGGASQPPVPAYPSGAGDRGGIVVKPGDTLFAISRYHQTALDALIAANDLTPPYIIRPGQVLRLPDASAAPVMMAAKPQIVSKALTPPVSSRRQDAPGKKPAGGGGQNIPVSIPPGHVENPVTAESGDLLQDSGEDQTSGILEMDEKIPLVPRAAPDRKTIKAETVTAPIAKPVTASVAAVSPAARQMRFLWPAKGPILSDFGPKQNGLHNDGINIAMPPNGPVRAAGSGTVSYAGNGLRGYGNLILIRHQDGWVTAYAHNSELLVKKGDTVERGQQIARAGRSGGVAQDQLHFEVRHGAKAVNPKPLLVGR